jgi:hypothetical protein
MTNVHLRSDICDVMSWQVSCGSFDAAQTDRFRNGTFYAGLNAISSESVAAAAKNELFMKPVLNTLTVAMTLGVVSSFYG